MKVLCVLNRRVAIRDVRSLSLRLIFFSLFLLLPIFPPLYLLLTHSFTLSFFPSISISFPLSLFLFLPLSLSLSTNSDTFKFFFVKNTSMYRAYANIFEDPVKFRCMQIVYTTSLSKNEVTNARKLHFIFLGGGLQPQPCFVPIYF